MSPSAHLALGRQWLERGRADRAEEALRKALAETPEDAECLGLLAAVTLQQGRRKEGLELARSAVGAAPDWAFTHGILSDALRANDRSKEAEAAARQAIALDPEDSRGHGALAAALGGQKRWREARVAAEEGLELDPECPTCGNLRALALIQSGEGDRADFALEAALQRDPEDPSTHENLGWSALHRGDPEAAIRHYREALRLDPTSDIARSGLVEALNARSWIYRIFLRWFLLLTRVPQRTVFLIFVGSILARGALRGLAESQPAIAPVVLTAYWVIVGFILLTWVAQPIFNALLWFDRDGRHALDESQQFQAKWVFGWLVGTGVCVAAWLAGVPAMGLTAALVGALTIPVAAAAGRTGAARVRLGLATAALAVAGGVAVVNAARVAPWRSEIRPYLLRLSPEELENLEAQEAEVATWTPEDRESYIGLVEASPPYVEADDRAKTWLGFFLLGFVGFTWLSGAIAGRE